jgi:hypothetical protein
MQMCAFLGARLDGLVPARSALSVDLGLSHGFYTTMPRKGAF